MWYKNFSSIGIRRKFGDGKQCFSFGGKKCGLGKDALMNFGYMVLKKLDAGQKEKDVKAWVAKAVERDSQRVRDKKTSCCNALGHDMQFTSPKMQG